LKNIEEIVKNIAASVLERDDYFIVEVTLTGARNNQKVKVLIDGDHGVDIDVCATVSKKLSRKIDELDLIKDNYVLEVSSAGIDYPLTSQRQYKKNIGRMVRAFLQDNKTVEGKLIAVNNDSICIQKKETKKEEKKEYNISYDEIKEIKVQVSFK
jgi:ribosome maturation factor RimP